jgi:uncharacterized protein (TIGR03067 family)
MRPLQAMALAAGLLVAADGRSEDAAKAEAKKLMGTWVVVSCEKDGEKVPANILQGEVVRLIIRADTITIKVQEEIKSENRYTLGPSAKPRAINLTDKDGRKALGIYSLEEEILQICWTERGKARPTEFATKPGSGFDLFVLKRETK